MNHRLIQAAFVFVITLQVVMWLGWYDKRYTKDNFTIVDLLLLWISTIALSILGVILWQTT